MAIENSTGFTTSPDSLAHILEADKCLVQARAIISLMGTSSPHDTMPPMTMQEAAWAACDLLKRVDSAVSKLGRLAADRGA